MPERAASFGAAATDARTLEAMILRVPARGLRRSEGAGAFVALSSGMSATFEAKQGSLRIDSDAAGAARIYYAKLAAGEGLAFGASALEVLRAAGRAPTVDTAALHRYLSTGALPGSGRTLLREVHALRREHGLEWSASAPGSPREQSRPDAPAPRPTSAEEAAQVLRDELLRSLAPMASESAAVALSGGIDSSGVLGGLRALRGTEPIAAYAYLQRTPALPLAWDESRWARLAATHSNAALREVEVAADEIPALLAQAAGLQDFPFASPVILAQLRLFQLAREEGIAAVVSGHGADALFGGSDTYLAARLARLLRDGRVVAAARMAPGAVRHAAARGPRFLASVLARAARIPRTAAAARVPWLSGAWFAERIGATRERAEPRTLDMQEVLEETLSTSLVATTLQYEAANARACGLESCLPYLTRPMLRLARACAPEHFVSDRGEAKHVLRLALRGWVPDEILRRRERVGFAVPVLPWLLALRPWVDSRIDELASLPFFEPGDRTALWTQLGSNTPAAWSLAYRVWTWIALLEWARAHDARFE